MSSVKAGLIRLKHIILSYTQKKKNLNVSDGHKICKNVIVYISFHRVLFLPFWLSFLYSFFFSYILFSVF